jgi:hypothetical protein
MQIMKKAFAIIICIFVSLSVLASTINWLLYTKDGKHFVNLNNTSWSAETDGQQILFSSQDGEGSFSNGIRFTYSPPIFRSNGMTATPDEPTYMEIFVDGKMINNISLIVLGGKEILVDKRKIKYFKVETPKKKRKGIF